MLNTIPFKEKVICLTHFVMAREGMWVMAFDLMTRNQILVLFIENWNVIDGYSYEISNKTAEISEHQKQIDSMYHIGEEQYEYCNNIARKIAMDAYLEEMEEEREECY